MRARSAFELESEASRPKMELRLPARFLLDGGDPDARRYGGEMDLPLWGFLFDLPPFRRVVTSAVARAVAEESRVAEGVIDGLRREHRRELARWAERLARVERDGSELRRRVEVAADVASALREDLARERARASRLVEELQELQRVRDSERRKGKEEEEEEEEEERATADLFVCLGCQSIWELRVRPEGSCSVHKALGNGCDDCGDRTLDRLWGAKSRVIDGGEPKPASPLDEAPDAVPADAVPADAVPADAVPADAVPDAPSELVVRVVSKFVADLGQGGADFAVAKGVSREAGEYTRTLLWPAERCRTLSAIANGLAPIPSTVNRGIRWFATDIVGLPTLVAATLAEIATRALVQPFPLKELATAIRLVGAASCAAENQLAHCRCFRDLATKDVAEPRLAEIAEGLLGGPTAAPGGRTLDVVKTRVTEQDDPTKVERPPAEPEPLKPEPPKPAPPEPPEPSEPAKPRHPGDRTFRGPW
ncbi:MAG: hypothetical protein HOY78_33475 [Saccharothrix sp.]|nr:hypothetical protein [Saccharothrix sp.]